ncbi:MAG: cation:proton antiporter, partial [Planctomycetota bacterium]
MLDFGSLSFATLPLAAGEAGGGAVGVIITGVVVLGIFAQWVAWRLKVPSILLLLAFGFLAGPIAEWANIEILGTPVYVDVDRVFETPVLLTLVSLAVGLILFEGGLSLTWSEIRGVRPAVISLVTVGAAVTWILSSLAAKFILDLPTGIALLLGAILIVTGPTVIGPLIRFVRPTGSVGKVLKWEGIVIDPIGALVAVLVFEALLAGEVDGATAGTFIWGAVKASVVGTALGIGMGYLLIFMISRRLTPDHLQIPLALGMATLAFTVSNVFAPEAGLFATTVMGILLANQKRARVAHILEFKETLVVLMIGLLFIALSARLELSDLQQINWWRAALFLAVLILLVRPLSIFASTAGKLGGKVQFRDKLFLSWMAPRGIVAAAIASVFGISLQQAGVPGAELLTPYIFLVIVVTVAV